MKRRFLIAISFVLFFVHLSFIGQSKDSYKIKTIVIDAGHGGTDIGARGEITNEATITLAIALKLRDRLKQVLPDTKVIMTRVTEDLPGNLTDHNDANRLRAAIANESKGDLFISIHVNSAERKYNTIKVGEREETYYVKKGKKKKVAKTRMVPVYKKVRIPNTITGTETYVWASNKNDLKKKYISNTAEDMYGESDSNTAKLFADPEAMIKASLRTKKFFDRSLLLAELVQEEFAKQGRRDLGVKQRNHTGIWVLQATAMPSILVETGFICTPEEEEYLDSEKGQNEVSYAIMRAILSYKESIGKN